MGLARPGRSCRTSIKINTKAEAEAEAEEIDHLSLCSTANFRLVVLVGVLALRRVDDTRVVIGQRLCGFIAQSHSF